MSLYLDFTLEEMVMFDMETFGYDSSNPLDIEAFWEARLS
jgi:hypothetical protein